MTRFLIATSWILGIAGFFPTALCALRLNAAGPMCCVLLYVGGVAGVPLMRRFSTTLSLLMAAAFVGGCALGTAMASLLSEADMTYALAALGLLLGGAGVALHSIAVLAQNGRETAGAQ